MRTNNNLSIMSKKVLTFSLKTDDRNSVKAQKRKFLKFFAPVKNFLLIKYFFICDYINISNFLCAF